MYMFITIKSICSVFEAEYLLQSHMDQAGTTVAVNVIFAVQCASGC